MRQTIYKIAAEKPRGGGVAMEPFTGKMTIKIESGKHFYELEYILPTAK